ncbi:MAG: trimethylamine methyltransferase family protein, partial [Firmicutes bacterium]|nr:trimethylamine methyltransferase family protein [Bacillota bacterium]
MRARCTLMTDAEVQKIHETSMKILREIGVVFSYAPAREMLAKHGCKVEGQTVYFPTELVEERLKTVPSSFTLHGRNPEKTIEINT